jgi:biotin carboxyl carrier protein
LVGLLKEQANQLDLDYAYGEIRQRYLDENSDQAAEWAAVLDAKKLLFTRPLERLFAEPHYMSGWLSINKKALQMTDNGVQWLENPILLLDRLYHYLNMDYETGKPARYMIWDHDAEILSDAVSFYKALEEKLATQDFTAIEQAIAGDAPQGISSEEWASVRSAHAGYMAGTELLAILAHIASTTGFFDLAVQPDLSIDIPERLTDDALQKRMAKVLVPPPVAKSDEILAASGGMFYPREAPGMDVFVNEGDHFEAGDTLYIVEVMKMFNKVVAPFSGTIEKVLIDGDGVIIKKGQPLFKVNPDEKIEVVTPEQIAAERRAATDGFLKHIA